MNSCIFINYHLTVLLNALILTNTINNLFLWQSSGMRPDLLEDENPEMNEIGEDAHLLSSN